MIIGEDLFTESELLRPRVPPSVWPSDNGGRRPKPEERNFDGWRHVTVPYPGNQRLGIQDPKRILTLLQADENSVPFAVTDEIVAHIQRLHVAKMPDEFIGQTGFLTVVLNATQPTMNIDGLRAAIFFACKRKSERLKIPDRPDLYWLLPWRQVASLLRYLGLPQGQEIPPPPMYAFDEVEPTVFRILYRLCCDHENCSKRREFIAAILRTDLRRFPPSVRESLSRKPLRLRK